MHCLTINAGSSSIKYQLFVQNEKNPDTDRSPRKHASKHREDSDKLNEIFGGLIENIGESSGNWHQHGEKTAIKSHRFQNHQQAFDALSKRILDDLNGVMPDAVGHRVVHGGREYIQPAIVDKKILSRIKSLSRLAPLHNPANALGIECAQRAFPNSTHVAVFDTAFHAHMPDKAALYPIERQLAEKEQIRRYGFHGINHAYVAQQAALWLQKPLADCQFISLHLGNGASACLVKDGISQDTSMGMTPLSGLMMGTRCGDIDPAIPLYLINQNYSPEAVDKLLNKKSGLIGMAGDNDMRHLLERAADNDQEAELAITMYCYILQKTIGAYYSQCDRLDALIFTGGVGENAAAIRWQVLAPLAHLGLKLDKEANNAKSKAPVLAIGAAKPAILVVRGNEELAIAQQSIDCWAKAQPTGL